MRIWSVGILLIAGVAVAVFANSLSGGFVYDDVDNLLRNPWILEPGRLSEAFTHHMAAFSPGFDTSYYRPMLHVGLAALNRVYGRNPLGYHVALVLLHATMSVCVLVLLARADSGAAETQNDLSLDGGAMVASLLFAVHPIHTEAVAWISGVVDLSYSLFCVLTLLVLTSSSVRLHLLLAPSLFLLALLAKEPAVMLIPVILAFALARRDLATQGRRGRLAKGLGALGVAVAAYSFLRVRALGGLMGTGGANRVGVSLEEGLLTAVALFGEYVRLLLVPVGQTAIHDFRVATDLRDLRVWVGAASFVVIVCFAWRSRRSAAAVLGWSLMVLPLLPALYVPVLGEGLIGERYLYLPSVGLALLAARAWTALQSRMGAPNWARAALALTAVASYATATVARNPVWHDDVTLWADAVLKAPRVAAAHANLGSALLTRGDLVGAAASLDRAIELDPKRRDARTNLAAALAGLGRSEEAIVEASKVLAEDERTAEAHAAKGYALAQLGRAGEAIAEYERAVEIDPRIASLHNQLAIALARVGDATSAERHFLEAVRLEPGQPDFLRNLRILQERLAAGVRVP